MSDLIKICGLTTPEAVETALDAGADMIGLVRFTRSPRHLGLDAARKLSAQAHGKALRVALVVDAQDQELEAIVDAIAPDLIQLHGSETPERVADIQARFGRPVMKAVGVAEASDLAEVARYAGADRVLLDAKPPKAAGALPGGNGVAFDWRLVAALDPRLPFMLSGGLTPQTVADAIALTGARAIDVSSGVESRPGIKDPARIEAFVRAARAGFAQPSLAKDKVA